MSNNNTKTCAFDSNECNGKIHEVGDKVSISKTNIKLWGNIKLDFKF